MLILVGYSGTGNNIDNKSIASTVENSSVGETTLQNEDTSWWLR